MQSPATTRATERISPDSLVSHVLVPVALLLGTTDARIDPLLWHRSGILGLTARWWTSATSTTSETATLATLSTSLAIAAERRAETAGAHATFLLVTELAAAVTDDVSIRMTCDAEQLT